VAVQFSQTTRSLANDTSRYANIAWLLAGIFMAGWMLWLFAGTVTVYEISKHARLEVRQASHQVDALVHGKVAATALAIGTEVKAGDILVELDASSEELRLKEEEARLEAIPRRIAALQREIEAQQFVRSDDLQSASASTEVAKYRNQEADAALEFAKDQGQRLTRLSAIGGAATVDAMRAITETQKLTASRDALSSDLKRIELEARTRAHQHDAQIETLKSSIVSLEGEMAISQAAIARLKIDIEKHIVRAPISGRTGDVVPLHAGAYVNEGQRLATIVPEGELIVVADFSPSLTLGRVRAGQKGRLRLDGFPWAQYGTAQATVSRVASEIRDNLVRVELVLDAASSSNVFMQHGLPGSIEVSVEETSPASLILRSAGLLLSTPTRGSNTVAEPAQ
jgi:membrane fusion protein (multidrug efflux system)